MEGREPYRVATPDKKARETTGRRKVKLNRVVINEINEINEIN